MADFTEAFEEMIRNEGGYKLHTVKGDSGGQTYAGIARHYHPGWEGWAYIDANDMNNPMLANSVAKFYQDSFWNRLRGDDIEDQRVAEALFDFSVNTGLKTAIKLAQEVVGTTADGIIGPITIGKLNDFPASEFLYRYTVAKVARYAEIVNRDRSQSKFLLGWINRSLKGIG